jgi:hypothetical protein
MAACAFPKLQQARPIGDGHDTNRSNVNGDYTQQQFKKKFKNNRMLRKEASSQNSTPTFSDFIHKLFSNTQVPQMIIDGCRIITKQCIRISQTVTSLRFDGSISKILCEQECFPEGKRQVERMGKIQFEFLLKFKRCSTIPFLIRKLRKLSITKRKSLYLLVMFGCRFKLSEEDVGISEVAVCSPFGCFVPKLSSNIQSLKPQCRKEKKEN